MAGDWLFREGDPGDTLYVLRSGRLEIVQETGGNDMVIRSLPSGAVLGELALLTQEPRSASARARRDSTLLAVSREAFLELLESDPAFATSLSRTMAELLARTRVEATPREPVPPVIAVATFCEGTAGEAFTRELAEHLGGSAARRGPDRRRLRGGRQQVGAARPLRAGQRPGAAARRPRERGRVGRLLPAPGRSRARGGGRRRPAGAGPGRRRPGLARPPATARGVDGRGQPASGAPGRRRALGGAPGAAAERPLARTGPLGRRRARAGPHRRAARAAGRRRADRPPRRLQHGRPGGGAVRRRPVPRGDREEAARRVRGAQSDRRLHAAGGRAGARASRLGDAGAPVRRPADRGAAARVLLRLLRPGDLGAGGAPQRAGLRSRGREHLPARHRAAAERGRPAAGGRRRAEQPPGGDDGRPRRGPGGSGGRDQPLSSPQPQGGRRAPAPAGAPDRRPAARGDRLGRRRCPASARR